MLIKNLTVSFIVLSLFIFYGCSNSNVVPEKITVNGKTVFFQGTVVPDALVEINGQQVTTSADGSFSFQDVDVPYNVKFLKYNSGVYYKGLTTPNPVLYCVSPTGTSRPYQGTVKINLPFSTNSGQKWYFYVSPKNGQLSPGAERVVTGNTFNFLLSWIEGPVFEGDIYGLLVTGDSGEVKSYDGYYGATGIHLQNGGTVEFSPTQSQIINPSEVSYTVNVNGSGYLPQVGSIELAIGNLSFINAEGVFSYSQSFPFSYLFPTGIPVQPRAVFIGGASIGNTSIVKAVEVDMNTTVNMGNGVEFLSPPDNSTNVDLNTLFSWSRGDGNGIYSMEYYTSTGQGSFNIVTKDPAVTLTDFSSMGFNYNTSADYYWYVTKYYGYNSMDEYAVDPFFQKATGMYNVAYRQFNLTQNP